MYNIWIFTAYASGKTNTFLTDISNHAFVVKLLIDRYGKNFLIYGITNKSSVNENYLDWFRDIFGEENVLLYEDFENEFIEYLD